MNSKHQKLTSNQIYNKPCKQRNQLAYDRSVFLSMAVGSR